MVALTMMALALSEDSIRLRARRDQVINALGMLPEHIREVLIRLQDLMFTYLTPCLSLQIACDLDLPCWVRSQICRKVQANLMSSVSLACTLELPTLIRCCDCIG